MPSVITHCLCAYKAKSILKKEVAPAEKLLTEHKNMYTLGAQGPDLLFFCAGGSAVGETMHDRDIGGFFESSLEFALKAASDERKDRTFAYLAGFFAHYALDCTAHPYIFYHSGFDIKSGKLKKPFAEYHHRMETDIDTILCKKFLNKTPYQFNIPSKLTTDKKDRKILRKIFKFSVKHTYKIHLNPFVLFQLPYNFRLFYKLARSKHGIRKFFLTAAEKAITGQVCAASLIHSKPAEIDYLNLELRAWRNPWEDDYSHNDTFENLFDCAASKAYELIRMLYEVMYEGAAPKNLLITLGNKSFSTGEQCELTMKYHACLF